MLPQQALAGRMVTAVDLQVAVEASAVKAPVVQSRIDRPAGLTGIFCLKAARVSYIGMTSLAQIGCSGI